MFCAVQVVFFVGFGVDDFAGVESGEVKPIRAFFRV